MRPIVPLVFYLGRGRWRHATGFSELFAREMREWRWLPRFEHVLVEQADLEPEGVRGTVRGRVAQLVMMAVFRAAGGWPALQRALPLLAELNRRGGKEQLRMFVLYVMGTQGEQMRGRFAAELRRQVPGAGGDTMNYLEELIQQGRQEGRQEGRLEGRIGAIEEMLRAGVSWPLIESATGIDQSELRALKQRLRASASMSEPPEASINGTEEAE